MSKFSLVFVLLILFNVSGQQSQFNCSQKLLFTPLDVKLCCKMPSLRLNKYRDQCYSKTFIGGIGRQIDESNYFINPCAVECVFQQAGALKNNHLNMTNMDALIRNNIPNNPELLQVLHVGFEKCGVEILDKLQEIEVNRQTISRSKNKGYQGLKIPCSPFAVLLSYCALRHAFINCPENSWVNSEVCNNARNYVKNCEPAKFGGPRQRKRQHGKMESTTAKLKNTKS
ncbi:uncharacterized protein LOC129952676 [Eupeodes corollae]|uniref:uncharacterized protein LOC129952676 n=1 Tax=Eupeodes corollae TaxID=290404 RepID=UPI0024910478|nr:uncharacterized protein LOC129952676 [Eupeodes corollae]